MVTETKTNKRKKTYRRRKLRRKIDKKTLDENYELLRMDPDELIRTMSRRDPVLFAETHLKNEKDEPLEFDENHAFQKEYVRDFSPELVVIKSSQTGITTTSATKLMFLAHLKTRKDWKENFGLNRVGGLTAIYTFPTSQDVKDFSSVRFKPMVNSSPMLVNLMGGRRGVDAVNRKRIGSSTVYFRGTWVERAAISVPADLIINDELDFSNQEVVEAFNSRLTHSDLKWWWKFSTPTIPNYGIDMEYKTSDMRRWMVRCTGCGKDQEIQFPENVFRKKVGKETAGYWGCRFCEKQLDRNLGQWVASYPGREKHGYKITPTICPWISADYLIKVRTQYKTERLYRNFGLGEAYAAGDEVITRELMLQRIERGQRYEPALDKSVYLGVDQGDVLHYELARARNNRREVFRVGTTRSFDDIGKLMNEYNVDLCVMDMLPNKKNAEKFAEDFHGRVMLAIYKEFDETDDVRASKTHEYGILLDRTNTLDMGAASWREGKSVMVLDSSAYPGELPLEIDNPADKDAFVQQMGNMTRSEIENKKTGKHRGHWLRTGPEHYRHADNYCLVAWDQRFGGNPGDVQVSSNAALTSSPGQIEIMGGPFSDYRSKF